MHDLFDAFPPMAHTHDPESSHAAAEMVVQSGALQLHTEAVLALVIANPGSTSGELDVTYQSDVRWRNGPPMDLTEIRRRLNTGLNLNWLRKGAQRKCRCKNTLQSTWYATGAGPTA